MGSDQSPSSRPRRGIRPSHPSSLLQTPAPKTRKSSETTTKKGTPTDIRQRGGDRALHRATATAEAAGVETAEAIREIGDSGRLLLLMSCSEERRYGAGRVILDQSGWMAMALESPSELGRISGTGSVLLSSSRAGDSNGEGDVAYSHPSDLGVRRFFASRRELAAAHAAMLLKAKRVSPVTF